jgi:CheY-like chemotaxis protein
MNKSGREPNETQEVEAVTKLIMVINDTKEILQLFEDILTDEGYRVSLHSYNVQDLQEVKKVKPDLIISDHLVTQEQLGWQFLQKLKMDRETENIPIIVCTTNMAIVRDNQGHLASMGVCVLPKPFNIAQLLRLVEELIGKADAPSLGSTSLNPRNSSKQ